MNPNAKMMEHIYRLRLNFKATSEHIDKFGKSSITFILYTTLVNSSISKSHKIAF